MALEIRRIVPGHDANGKAIITTDQRLAAAPIDAEPAEIDGEALPTQYPAR